MTDLLGQPNGAFIGNIDNLNVNPGTDWHLQDPFVHDAFV